MKSSKISFHYYPAPRKVRSSQGVLETLGKLIGGKPWQDEAKGGNKATAEGEEATVESDYNQRDCQQEGKRLSEKDL